MNTKHKVMLGLLIILLAIVAIGGVAIYSFKNITQKSKEVEANLKQESFFLEKTIGHLKWDINLTDFILKGGDTDIQLDHTKCALGKWYYGFINTDKFNTLPKEIQDEILKLGIPHKNLHRSAEQIIALVKQNKKNQAYALKKTTTDRYLSEVQSIIQSINNHIEDMAVNMIKSMDEEVVKSNTVIISAFALGVVIFGLILFIIFRSLSILEKLKPFNQQFAKAALGDLTVEYPVKKVNCSVLMRCGKQTCPDYGKNAVLCWFDVGSLAPEFGKEIHCPKILSGEYKSCAECKVYKMVCEDEVMELAVWFNKFIMQIHDMIGAIRSGMENLNFAVQEIASGNENLSQRTTEQASALEEIVSTIEEATAAINLNAENSSQAKDLTIQGVENSIEGNHVAKDAVESINEMNSSSRKIAEIISVINEIAFQTNLLALNAAVEAARAGDQGRGFAVVAGEVRNLAQRSGSAAKEIETLIQDAVGKIGRSTELVNNTGEALSDISEASKTTAILIGEIAEASNEQRQGLNQINVAISEMDEMTQQNASLVEEVASASEEMSNQAVELTTLVERFKIKGIGYA